MGYSQLFQLPPPAGVVAPVVNITSISQTINYLGSDVWTGYTIVSYKGTATPSIDTVNKKILFTGGIGTIWDILIDKNGGGNIFLPCQEGFGNDGLNRTIYNQYADNYTDHFLLSTTGLWKNIIRQDVYKDGYSLKTNIAGLLDEKVTNGTFDSDVSGWTLGTYTATSLVDNTIKIQKTLTSSAGAYCYQLVGSIYKIFRYIFGVDLYSITDAPAQATLGTTYVYYDGSTFVGSYDIMINSYTLNTWLRGQTNKTYLNGASYYVTLLSSGASTINEYVYEDNVTLKVYEDNVKIPISLNNTVNDCLGNVKTELPDLIAYYPFNGNANDESGNGFNGTNNGATLVTNRFGITDKAYDFNGNTSNINIGNIAALNFNSNDFSICGWFKLDSRALVYDMVFSKMSTIFGALLPQGYALAIRNDTYKLLFKSGDGVNAAVTVESTSTIELNKFYFFTILWDSTNGALFLYLNSKFEKESTTFVDRNLSTTSNFYIGYEATSPTYFNGIIDDVRIYSKILSIPEIKTLYREKPDNSLYLYNYGYEGDTWINGFLEKSASATITRTKNSDNLNIYIDSDTINPTDTANYQTTNKIDLSKYSKLIVVYEHTVTVGTNGGTSIKTVSTTGGSPTSLLGSIAPSVGSTSSSGTLEFDISNSTQNEYITIENRAYNNTNNDIKIYKLQLIP